MRTQLKTVGFQKTLSVKYLKILSNFAKIFEICLYNRIYLSIKPLLSSTQHEFFTGKSTHRNPLIFTQYLSNVLHFHGKVDVDYPDRIGHCILLKKLEWFGFSPVLMNLFSFCIKNRIYYVAFNRYCKFWSPSGIQFGPVTVPNFYQ